MCQCQLWDITSFNKSYPQTWSVVKLSEKGTKPSSRLSVSWRKVRNLTLDYLCEASFYVGLDSSKVSLILEEILVFSFKYWWCCPFVSCILADRFLVLWFGFSLWDVDAMKLGYLLTKCGLAAGHLYSLFRHGSEWVWIGKFSLDRYGSELVWIGKF